MENTTDIIKENNAVVDAEVIQETDAVQEAEKPKKKRRGPKAVLIIVAVLIVLVLCAAVFLMEPWAGQTEPVDPEIMIETVTDIKLSVGDTMQLEPTLGENETLVSFVSDCPEALSVDDSGMAAALAEYPVTVTATLRETEVPTPELTRIQKIKSELRILVGLDERIDYSTMEPRILRVLEYKFLISGVPTEEIDFQVELIVDDAAEFELEIAEGEHVRITSGDESVATIEDGIIVKAVAPGETTLTATFGFEKEIDGETVFMATRAEIYPLTVKEQPASTGGGRGGSGSSGSTSGRINPSTGNNGSGSTSGGSGSSGSGSGSGSGGGTGGGTITAPRTYPLPSESEVAAFIPVALGYANSLGLGTNSGLNTGNSGYGSPACTWELPWSTVKGDVYWQIDQIHAMAMADPGFQSGMAVINITYSFYMGEYYIYVMWG